MELKINDHNVALVFGMAFVRELNHLAGVATKEGINLGMALQTTIPSLIGADPVAIANVIYAATAHVKTGRPTQEDVDAYLENEVEDWDKLAEKLVAELEKSNVTKRPLQAMKAAATENQG